MKKHLWIAIALVFVLAIPAAASQAVKIFVNGDELKSDVPGQIIDGRTLAPVRAIAESLGGTVAFDAATNSVTINTRTPVELASLISAEWSGSGHANENYPLSYAGKNAGCMPCHSGNQLERFGTAEAYKPGDFFKAIPADAKAANAAAFVSGELAFDTMYDSHDAIMPTTIGCATCHAGAGKQIMDSGVVPAAANVFSGKKAEWNVGSQDALCFTCHNGRRDAKAMYESWTTPGATPIKSYPHHGWGALVSGLGGMEYPGVTYAQSNSHKNLGCVGCHMPEKDGYVSHEFKPDIATCVTCHKDATEFTLGGGLEKELEEKLATLEKLVLAKIPGAAKLGTGNSDWPAVDANGVLIDPTKTAIPAEALVGAYNWTIVHAELHEGGKGVHNPRYAKALLDESIKKLQ